MFKIHSVRGQYGGLHLNSKYLPKAKEKYVCSHIKNIEYGKTSGG